MLQGRINTYSVERLKKSILRDSAHLGKEDLATIGRAIDACILSYGRAERSSGHHPAATHPLRAAALAASLGAEAHTILGAIFHDLPEDALDGKHPDVKLRYINGEGKVAEFADADGIYSGIAALSGAHGERVLQIVKDLTNLKQKGGKEADWEQPYFKYLQKPYGNFDSALVKVIDAIVNLMELDSLEGIKPAKREAKRQKTVKKALMQLRIWQKISWPIAELLLSCMQKYAGEEYGQIRSVARAVDPHDLEKFKRGCCFVDYERSKQGFMGLIDLISRDGSRTIDVYRARFKGNHVVFQIELPIIGKKIGQENIRGHTPDAIIGAGFPHTNDPQHYKPLHLRLANLFSLHVKISEVESIRPLHLRMSRLFEVEVDGLLPRILHRTFGKIGLGRQFAKLYVAAHMKKVVRKYDAPYTSSMNRWAKEVEQSGNVYEAYSRSDGHYEINVWGEILPVL